MRVAENSTLCALSCELSHTHSRYVQSEIR